MKNENYSSFDEFRNSIMESHKLKKSKKGTILQIKKILKVLFESQEIKLRSSEISYKTKIEKKHVDSRLNRLARIDLIKVSWRWMKYLKDDLNDKAIFPGKISEKTDIFLENLLRDCTERKEIKEIIIETLTIDYPKTSEKVIKMIKDLKESDDLELILDELKETVEEDHLLWFYQKVFEKIYNKGLFDESKDYWRLTRQCIAHKYVLKE